MQYFPAEYSLRSMQEQDLDRVMEVEVKVYDFPWSRENFESCLRSRYECCVLMCGDTHVGHSVLSAAVGESHLLNLSISEGYQGQGLGRKMLRYMLVRAKQLKAKVTFLEVRVTNTKAFELYLSEGFNEVGRREGYYPAGKKREDALVLAIDL